MDKKTFETRIEELDHEITMLYKEKRKLFDEYKQSNMQFPIGTKVKVTTNGNVEYGIIKDYEVTNITHNVTPVIAKLTKKGVAHKTATLWVKYFLHPTIEKC